MIRTFALAACLFAATACHRGAGHDAEVAAEQAHGKLVDVRAAQTAVAKDSLDHSKDLAKKADAYVAAQTDFELKRARRVELLRAEHALVAGQPPLLASLATISPLTEAGRADVNEKLQILTMRLDETGNAITALQTVDAGNWTQRDNEAARALSRLDDARDAAFEALRTAPRTGTAS